MALKPALIAGVSFPTSAESIQATGTPDGTTFLRGDGTWAVPAGGGGSGAVDSVNGKTGTVVLDANDVGAFPASSAGDLATKDNIAVPDIAATGTPDGTTFLRGDGTWAVPAGGGAVDSVNGQTGAVVLDANDVGAVPNLGLPFTAGLANARALTANDGLHHTFYVMTIVLPGGKWMMFSRISEIAHSGVDLNASIYMQTSYDRGVNWTAPVAIYSGGGTADPRGLVAKIMGNGRIGLIIPRCPSVGTYISPAFVWSDDGGTTWNNKVLTVADAWSGASTDIYQYPASIGGNDTLGFIAYSASGHTTTNQMVYLRTLDNGETWTSGTAMPNVPGVELSSIGVARLGTSNRWIALVRDADTSGPLGAANERNGLCYKSTDMINWTGPYDTGQMLNNNPANCLYHNGLIYWMAANRTSMARPIAASGNLLAEGMVHQWEDAETIWTNNGTAWPGWSDCCAIPNLEGHPTWFQDEGHWFANFGFNLRNLGTPKFSSTIGLLSDVNLNIDYSRILQRQPEITAGRWTPSFTFATPGDLSVVNHIAAGRWTRIGDIVTLMMQFQFTPTYTTSSGNALITGLPFNIKNDFPVTPGLIQANSITPYPTNCTQLIIIGVNGVKQFRPIGQGPNAIGAVTAALLTSGSTYDWRVTFSYVTDE